MGLERRTMPRRDFLNIAGIAGAAAVGILAFPLGLSEVIESAGPDRVRVTRTYDRIKVAGLGDLVEGEPLDFQYPLKQHNNFLVKLGSTAFDGVGLGKDIVAFNYLCSHMGCPLNGAYRHQFRLLGPCPCH